ncbi:MAG: MFS transporter [Denitrobacterium sp.]|nr:MFS transporter [Denitrobacterium sp.]
MVEESRYRSVIVACCFVLMFVSFGFSNTSFSVYQPYIVELPGVGDTGGSFIVGLRTLSYMVATIFVNRFYAALHMRWGVFVAMLCTVLAFSAFALADGMPLLCAGAVLGGLGMGFGGMVGMTLVLNRWFDAHVSTAIGIASVGSAAASVVVPLVAYPLIQNVSLHAAFGIEALVAAAAAVVLLFLVHDRPSQTAAPAAAADQSAAPDTAAQADPEPGRRPIPAHAARIILAGMFLLGMMTFSGLPYISILMTTEGLSPVFAASMVSLTGFVMMFSKLAVGVAFDRAGTRRGSLVFFLILFAGLACFSLMPLHWAWLALAGTLLYSLGVGLASTGVSIWSLELSNPGESARSVRNFQISYTLGGVCYSMFPGLLKETFGTYSASYFAILLFAVGAAAIILWAYRAYRPDIR